MGVSIRRLLGRCDLLAAAAAFPERYPCLLESAGSGGVAAQARYDLLFWHNGESLELGPDGQLTAHGGALQTGDFLAALDRQWQAVQTTEPSPELPYVGGWVLYLGYELAAQIESRLSFSKRSPRPQALALRCPAAALIDHHMDATWLVAEAGYGFVLDQLAADLQCAPALAPDPTLRLRVEEDPPHWFLQRVLQVQEYLREGAVFQANLSRGWRACADEDLPSAALYARLRQANPAPFAGLLQRPDWALASSSPERLLELRDGWAQTRPIAGTRSRQPGEDELSRIRELIGHPKERAEHVMLVDLSRNDLGRICQPGTVEVDELMTVESYAHVHHIVSNIRGRLQQEITPGQAIAALFPGGSITGCPKLRCMQILAELEDSPRASYTGALGYLDRRGALDLNILIRTLELVGNELSWRAGAGIVIDSVPEAELAETRVKARGLLRALGAAAELVS